MAKHIRTVEQFIDGQQVTEITEAVDETKPTKAIVGGAITVAVTFLSSLVSAMTDNPDTLTINESAVTPVEWLTATVAALVSAGLVFGGVYVTTNKPKA